jgi:tetratricopeptide (TPR) repeat protein
VKTLKVIVGLLAIASMMVYFFGCQSTATTSAKLYMQQEEYDKAIEQLEMEVAQNPKNAEASYYLGFCYSHEKRFEEMNKAFDGSLAVSDQFKNDINNVRKKYWVDSFNSGVRKLQNEQAEEAIKDLETAILIDPTVANAFKNLGFAYIQLDQDEKALDAYKKAAELDPSDVRTWVVYGIHNFNMKDYQATLDAMNKALELDPNEKEAMTYVGLAYNMMDQDDKAMESYNTALAKDPDSPDLYFNRGRLYYLQDKYEEAIDDFKKVVETNPEDNDALLHLGTCYLYVGEKFQKERAELENNEGSATKIKELKDMETSNYQHSMTYLEKASLKATDDYNLWYNLGVVYVRLGMPKKGEEAFKKAEEIKP